MALTEKQRAALRAKAAEEQAARAEKDDGKGRRRRKDPDDANRGLPPGVLAIIVLFLLIGSAMGLGIWLSSDGSFLDAPVPDDFGTSEDKGGYISAEGLPPRGSISDISGNPAGDGNMTAEEIAAAEAGGNEDDGGEASGEDDVPPGEEQGGETRPSSDIDTVHIRVPAYLVPEDGAEAYAEEQGWLGAEVGTDGYVTYSLSRGGLDQARSRLLFDLQALMQEVDSSVLGAVSFDGDNFSAFLAEARDPAGSEAWKTALEPVLKKAAERLLFEENTDAVPMAYIRNADGTEIGTVSYKDGVAAVVLAGETGETAG